MVSEEFTSSLCLNEPPVKLFIITDGKNVYKDKHAYREVVLQRGDDITDIVYKRGAVCASHDRDNIKMQLMTYGYDEAKALAEYIKTKREQETE